MSKTKDPTAIAIIDRTVKVVDQIKARYEMQFDAALADSIGVDKMTVSRWRSREYPPSTIDLYRLARKYGVNTDWIVTGRGAAFPSERADEKRYLVTILKEVRALSDELKLVSIAKRRGTV